MEKRADGRFIKGHRYSPSTEFKKGQHWRPRKNHWDAKWLREEYEIKKRSAQEIANENGCTENNILFWLHKHGIQRRSTNETRAIKHWGLVGADNPMWNRKGELNPHWKGGCTPERQTFYISKEWKNACLGVWKRDRAICQRCRIQVSAGIPFHIHHIISFAVQAKRADINNLILLCEICHHWVHSRKNLKREFLG